MRRQSPLARPTTWLRRIASCALAVGGTALLTGCGGAPSPPAPGLGRTSETGSLPSDLATPAQSDGSGMPAAAGPPTASPAPAGSGTAGTAAAPSPTSDEVRIDIEAFERRLRGDLADAPDPVPPATELAGLLAGLERHGEALVAVDAALARVDSPQLRVVRAGLLRDLGQRHFAVAELRAVAAKHGAAALHPALLFELAELEWLEGNAQRADAILRELGSEPEHAEWCRLHAESRRALADEIAAGRPGAKVRVRDLLGNLRGAPLPTTRIAVLERLVAGAGVPGRDRLQLRERAVAIAAGDESGAVRTRAVMLAEPSPDFAVEFFDAALADDEPLVRRAAAARAAALLGARSRDVLLQQLDRESDENTFVALDRALATLVPDADPLAPGAAATPAGRAQVAARWRARWPATP